jgi:hypothetical protein
MVNNNKTKSIRELGSVDVTTLRAKALSLPDNIWASENDNKPNKFTVLKRTEHIVFRFVNSMLTHRASHDRPLWDEWKDTILPILRQVTLPYGYTNGQFPRIMLAKMPAGCKIERHIDGAPAAKFPHKIHVPLFTNDKAFFYVEKPLIGKCKLHMMEGCGYEVNNNTYHWAENNGDTDRIHLIFEYYNEDESDN